MALKNAIAAKLPPVAKPGKAPASAAPAPAKRGPGRPKGSKTKAKDNSRKNVKTQNAAPKVGKSKKVKTTGRRGRPNKTGVPAGKPGSMQRRKYMRIYMRNRNKLLRARGLRIGPNGYLVKIKNPARSKAMVGKRLNRRVSKETIRKMRATRLHRAAANPRYGKRLKGRIKSQMFEPKRGRPKGSTKKAA